MRAVVQRVQRASVEVSGAVVGAIAGGLLVLLGVGKEDTTGDAEFLVGKILNLRIFNDAQGKMNLSLRDTGGSLLVVSQFTLYGDCHKGLRPSYSDAAPPERANPLYEHFVAEARKLCPQVQTGVFQAKMDVHLVNDGPVTLILDSHRTF